MLLCGLLEFWIGLAAMQSNAMLPNQIVAFRSSPRLRNAKIGLIPLQSACAAFGGYSWPPTATFGPQEHLSSEGIGSMTTGIC